MAGAFAITIASLALTAVDRTVRRGLWHGAAFGMLVFAVPFAVAALLTRL